MRGRKEEAGMEVALPPAPPTPRGEVLKSGGVDHSGALELGSEPEQEPAVPGGAETKVAVPVKGAPCGEGSMSLGPSGFSPPGVPGGDSPYADDSCCPVRIDLSVKPNSSANTVGAFTGVSASTNKAHTLPVPQHTSAAQVESLSATDEDTVPVPGTEEQRLAEALAASAADAGHEAEESTQPHQDGERQWHAVRVTVMTETRLALGVHRDPETNQRRFDCFGGIVEEGESVRQAAVRELRE
eukprot:SAG11_NODE_10969_length_792_cov_4.911977_1_plen_241_part_10